VNQSSSIANPIPSLSSPTLTCTVDLSEINIQALLLLRWTGPGFFNIQENVPINGSEGFLERTALLSIVIPGINDGVYNCSARILPRTNLLTGDGAGSDTIDIEIAGEPLFLNYYQINCM
jgi:hypothetical protein